MNRSEDHDTAQPSNSPFRHHFVTAGYIGMFATPRGRDGRIFVQDHSRAKEWISKPEKVAWQKDLYRVDGKSPLAVERFLSQAERRMLDAIKAVDDALPTPPTGKRADGVVSFVALQLVRGPEVRREFERFIEDLLRIVRSVNQAIERQSEQTFSRNRRTRRNLKED